MGFGNWSDEAYSSLRSTRLSTHNVHAFTHDSDIKSGRVNVGVHERLDPKGVTFRESRDSDEHPESNAIAVLFDVTGSMGHIPRTLQEKLPKLMGVLLAKGYIDHPQILFGAIGDAYCDNVPLQIGQFESDVNMDEDIDKIYLEGGGGGQIMESYDLGMYFMARHTSMDCYEKRGKRGYLFLIGDESYYNDINHHQVKNIIGDGLQSNIAIEDLVAELREKFEVFFIIPTNAFHGGNKTVQESWKKLFGQNVLLLDDPNLVCETIATQIGICEGVCSPDGAMCDLGLFGKHAESVSRAVSTNINTNTVTKTNVEGGTLVTSDTSSGVETV